jgi:hypothetical protein
VRCDDALVAVSLRADDELPDDRPPYDRLRADDAQPDHGLRAGDGLPDDRLPDGRPPTDDRPPADGGHRWPAVEAHLTTCADCRRFAATVREIRSQLRVEPVDQAPDLGPTVVARLRVSRTNADRTAAGPADPAVPETAGEPATGDTPRPSPRVPRARRLAAGGRLAVAAAVAAVAGMAAGVTFVGVGVEPRSPAGADVPERIVAAQHDIDALDSRFTISEVDVDQPAQPASPAGQGARTFDGRLAYRAPESLALSVQETTPGVAPADRAGGGLVVADDSWRQETARRCSPAAGLVRCPDEPDTWVRSVSGREPFSAATPVPLELVSPVDSFTLAATPVALGGRTIAGHPAVGVTVTAAQVAPLLDGLSAAVDLRPVHPADPVELWLDDEHLVPLALVVRAADDPSRAAWATTVGAGEHAGDVVLTLTTTDATINGPTDDETFEAPTSDDPATTRVGPPTADAPVTDAASTSTDAGFRTGQESDPAVAAVPIPDGLPAGLHPHRTGTVATSGGPAVGVRSWSDGRAWLTVRATTAWVGGRLFGDLGVDVRPVGLGGAGTGYASSDGRHVGLHTRGLDVVVSGSLPAEQLQSVAADLDVVGLAVPDDWVEAATATVDEAAATVPGLLTVPDPSGFGAPAVRIDSADGDPGADDDAGGVAQVYAGPGRRAVTLTQRLAPALPPPSTGDETGLEVRNAAGRYSQQSGELEWVEDGIAVSLRSTTLGLGELLAIAGDLEPA